MRFFVFTLLAIGAVSAVPAENPNGSPLLRQKRESTKTIEQNCEPLKVFRNFCNTCVCTADGKIATCTNDDCLDGVYNEDGSNNVYETVGEKNCEPGKYFKVGCNVCWCSYSGQTSRCTLDSCERTTCEPGTVTRNGCYECTCTASGKQTMCVVAKHCSNASE